jgi:hypothetical protein
MPKFAVYYISPPNEFYHQGASIVGYDLRTQQHVEMTTQLQDQINYDPSWNALTHHHGFHCTIGCSLDFHYVQLPAIEQEITDLLACFHPDHPFLLHKGQKPIVSVRPGSPVVGLPYEANTYLQIFHALIVARMQPFGTNSRFLQAYLENPEQYRQHPHRARKILKFYYYPWILDEYGPHFTLLHPFTGTNHTTIEQQFTELVIQHHDDAPYEIYREFHRENIS